MQGLHLTSDLSGCAAAAAVMQDTAALRRLCLEAVAACGLQPVGEAFHGFAPGGAGVTGVVLLAESHLAVHTWPEIGGVTLDVYVCNLGADNSARARQLMGRLEQAFGPRWVERHQIDRGALLSPATPGPLPHPPASPA